MKKSFALALALFAGLAMGCGAQYVDTHASNSSLYQYNGDSPTVYTDPDTGAEYLVFRNQLGHIAVVPRYVYSGANNHSNVVFGGGK